MLPYLSKQCYDRLRQTDDCLYRSLFHDKFLVFVYVTETKDQWARDDPAFLVLLSIWLCGMFPVIVIFFFMATLLIPITLQ